MSTLQEILEANRNYSQGFDKGGLPMPPARKIAILTCMDARLIPALFAGLKEGDAHVIRNAGGRASDDAIRSLVISHKLLGTEDWFVIHHTDCGMLTFTDEVMSELLTKSLKTAVLKDGQWQNVSEEGGSVAGYYLRWLTIKKLEESVLQDVLRLRNHPLVDPAVRIYGLIYDVRTGKLKEVPEAMEAGKPRA